jgi:hypothetical protein
MWTAMWIILGIFSWMGGFMKIGDKDHYKSFARLPRFIYLLCGLPKTPNIPSGVMAVMSITLQLQGILFVIYGATYRYWTQSIVLQSFLLFIGTMLLYINGWILYKRHPYKV